MYKKEYSIEYSAHEQQLLYEVIWNIPECVVVLVLPYDQQVVF